MGTGVTAYYNEIDPYAANWLRNLIAVGHIAPGVVDERSIEDVKPSDLRGFKQCHFFAGVGVWSHALRRAGWSDNRPVWTGSCPCQPFSSAGKGNGFADERHLWPSWLHLIAQCKPSVVFGEQVASKDANPWIDLVHTDMEALGYAFGAVPFPSAGIGAPHIRDRLYWVGYAGSDDDTAQVQAPCDRYAQTDRSANQSCRPGVSFGELGNTQRTGLAFGIGIGRVSSSPVGANKRQAPERASIHVAAGTGPTNGHWRDADWLMCRDGKWRPVEPGTFPLAHGATSRVGRLCAYGNAINAEAATEFIKAAM